MARFSLSNRSTEAPMDFQFTSRPSSKVKPAWATSNEDGGSPRKRPHMDTDLPPPAFPAPSTPRFGANTNTPFMFQVEIPQTPPTHPWTPPSGFSPTKAFPSLSQEDVKDVDMAEMSPPQLEDKKGGNGSGGIRAVARGAMVRVFRSRQKARDRSRLAVVHKPIEDEENTSSSGSDDEERERAMSPFPQNMSNHYTLNMPAPPPPKSDTPYILIGYTQFFFNSALVLIFLYLLVQFILTVQRDVEERISEYSREIVQEIGSCALQYRNNLCETNPIPALAHQCATWETCMNRDPTKVGRARVGAELIAEVINGFVEPISWKTLIFVVTSISFFVVFANTIFNIYLKQYAPSPASSVSSAPPLHHQPSFPIMPTTPYQPHQRYLSPAPGWGPSVGEEPRTPGRRRRRLDSATSPKVR